MSKKIYQWTVIGAGPAGITAVGVLLDSGVLPENIMWIDPHFKVGDFGRLWGEVNSNTRVALFQKQLHSVKSFGYTEKTMAFSLDQKDPEGFTELKEAAAPLQWVSDRLREKVITQMGHVKSLFVQGGAWCCQTESDCFLSEKVILAIGSEPKSLDYPGISKIDLEIALTPTQLKKAVTPDDIVAVFGSSHSAMISIRHLIEAGVKKVINFYLSPLRYAVIFVDWILYDDTGLKGETAAWVREHIGKNPLKNISRYLSTPEHIEAQLPNCTKSVYTVGFQPRHIPIEGVFLENYDISNGIIAPGLFGMGIAFPVVVSDPFGRKESNVGVWKFYKNMKRTLPLWEKYGLS